ncbi:hypothetical protein AKO1_015206 [Acrasis kona]|uniref:Uncharacterized protein n=1 Tax=Acrasis kona TaxID=1008807 RepID=A0AAW2ZEX2_9EUKA
MSQVALPTVLLTLSVASMGIFQCGARRLTEGKYRTTNWMGQAEYALTMRDHAVSDSIKSGLCNQASPEMEAELEGVMLDALLKPRKDYSQQHEKVKQV